MIPFIRNLSLALLVTSTTAGLAVANVAPLPDAFPPASSEAIAAARTFLSRGTQRQSYALSNNRSLLVERMQQSIRLHYGDRTALVRYDGHGNFVSEDGLLRLQFLPSQDGEPDNVSLSMPATWR